MLIQEHVALGSLSVNGVLI